MTKNGRGWFSGSLSLTKKRMSALMAKSPSVIADTRHGGERSVKVKPRSKQPKRNDSEK